MDLDEKEELKVFLELMITLLGTYFAAYTIAKDYVDMVAVGKQSDFNFLILVSTIYWGVLMLLLFVVGYLIFVTFLRKKKVPP